MNKSTRNYLRLVQALSIALALAQLAYFALAWLAPGALHAGPVTVAFSPRGMNDGEVERLTAAMRWTGGLCALPALLMLGYALARLDRMLRACAAGHPFAFATVGHMKGFIGGILAALALSIAEPALRGAVWRFGLGTAPRAVGVGAAAVELMLLLVCVLLLAVASMMQEARRLAEENEGFV